MGKFLQALIGRIENRATEGLNLFIGESLGGIDLVERFDRIHEILAIMVMI